MFKNKTADDLISDLAAQEFMGETIILSSGRVRLVGVTDFYDNNVSYRVLLKGEVVATANTLKSAIEEFISLVK